MARTRLGSWWFRVPAALLLFLTLGTSATFGTSAQDDVAENSSSVRFIHGSPDAPALDVLIDGVAVSQGLEHGTVTDFAPLAEGEHAVQVVPAGEAASSALIDESIDTDEGGVYTIAVANLLNSLELVVVESNLDDLDEGQARIRLINLSTDAGNVDLAQVGGDEWFDDVEFGEASDHHNVDEGSYDLEVRAHDADVPLITQTGLQVERGNEVSLYLLGSQADESLQLLVLAANVDTSCAVHLGLSELDDDACVRITYAALEGPAVDVYLEGSVIAEGLEAGQTSDFFAVPAGDDRTVSLVPAGGALEDQILESDVDLEGGDATDVIVGGDVSDLKVVNAVLDLSPVASDQSRVRAVNLSSDAGDIDILVTDGDTLFGGVGFEDFADAILLDAGTYDIQVQAVDGDDILFRSESLTIDPGMSYELVATGSVDSGTFTLLVVPAPAQLRTAEDAAGTASPEATTLNATTPTPAAEAVEATPTS